MSLLSLLSDVLESHTTNSIKKHLLITNHVFEFVNQWDFQKGKSTTLALLSTVHLWHVYLEDSKVYAT